MESSGIWGVTNIELERAVAAVDRSALLVPPRILRRVLRHGRRLSETGLSVPHRKTYCVQRDELAAVVEPDELGRSSFDDLPERIILLARPEPEQLAATTRPRTLIKFWRMLFHARLHVELERLIAADRLNATVVKERITSIG